MNGGGRGPRQRAAMWCQCCCFLVAVGWRRTGYEQHSAHRAPGRNFLRVCVIFCRLSEGLGQGQGPSSANSNCNNVTGGGQQYARWRMLSVMNPSRLLGPNALAAARCAVAGNMCCVCVHSDWRPRQGEQIACRMRTALWRNMPASCSCAPAEPDAKWLLAPVQRRGKGGAGAQAEPTRALSI